MWLFVYLPHPHYKRICFKWVKSSNIHLFYLLHRTFFNAKHKIGKRIIDTYKTHDLIVELYRVLVFLKLRDAHYKKTEAQVRSTLLCLSNYISKYPGQYSSDKIYHKRNTVNFTKEFGQIQKRFPFVKQMVIGCLHNL